MGELRAYVLEQQRSEAKLNKAKMDKAARMAARKSDRRAPKENRRR